MDEDKKQPDEQEAQTSNQIKATPEGISAIGSTPVSNSFGDANQGSTDTGLSNASSDAKPEHQDNQPGVVVLQWLTYAFWGWVLLAFSGLISSVLVSLILGEDTGEFTIYTLAAVIVLLPIAFFCDKSYVKNEPQKKTGAAMAVMIIHAVIFALIGVGLLIAAVFTAVSLVVSSGSIDEKITAIVTCLVISLFYLLTFARTLNLDKLKSFTPKYRMFMLVSAVLLGGLGIIGPVAKQISLKNDKLIVHNLSMVESRINDYVRDNDQLPSKLSEVKLEGDAKLLVDKGLVTYKPGETVTEMSLRNSSRNATSTEHRYELCVTYKQETKNYKSYSDYDYDSDEYTTYVSAYSHPAGDVCYKLKTTDYGF